MSNNKIEGMEQSNSQFKTAINEANKKEKMQEEQRKKYQEFVDKYSQEKDGDFEGVRVVGKHFLFKAPKREQPSGLILPGKESQQKISGVTGGSFDEQITAVMVDEKCEKVRQGDQVILSPHYQALKVEMQTADNTDDLVLYAMVHEDYVLMAKQ